jgi:hypothetical protein
MKLFVVLTLVFASSVFAQTPSPSAPASAKHPFMFEDMMRLKRLDEPVPSPDGRQRIRLLAPHQIATVVPSCSSPRFEANGGILVKHFILTSR